MDIEKPLYGNLSIWDNIFQERPWGLYPSEDLIRFVSRNFYNVLNRSSVRILEIGCGPSANVWYMAREGFSVSGIDGSPTAIKLLLTRLMDEGVAHDPDEFKVSNFVNLPWPDETFDAVIDVEALSANRLDVVTATLSEVRRVLKPGGWVFSKMLGPRTTGSSSMIEANTVANLKVGNCSGIGLIHFFTEEEIESLFSSFREVARGWVHICRTDGVEVFEWITTARK